MPFVRQDWKPVLKKGFALFDQTRPICVTAKDVGYPWGQFAIATGRFFHNATVDLESIEIGLFFRSINNFSLAFESLDSTLCHHANVGSVNASYKPY